MSQMRSAVATGGQGHVPTVLRLQSVLKLSGELGGEPPNSFERPPLALVNFNPLGGSLQLPYCSYHSTVNE